MNATLAWGGHESYRDARPSGQIPSLCVRSTISPPPPPRWWRHGGRAGRPRPSPAAAQTLAREFAPPPGILFGVRCDGRAGCPHRTAVACSALSPPPWWIEGSNHAPRPTPRTMAAHGTRSEAHLACRGCARTGGDWATVACFFGREEYIGLPTSDNNVRGRNGELAARSSSPRPTHPAGRHGDGLPKSQSLMAEPGCAADSQARTLAVGAKSRRLIAPVASGTCVQTGWEWWAFVCTRVYHGARATRRRRCPRAV